MIWAFLPIFKPLAYLVYLVGKYLIVGMAGALYVLLASILVFFFGYRPRNIWKGMKDAVLFQRRGDWEVRKYQEWRLWSKFDKHSNYSPQKIIITPFECLLVLGAPVFLVCLDSLAPISGEPFTSFTSFAVGLTTIAINIAVGYPWLYLVVYLITRPFEEAIAAKKKRE